MSPEEITYFAQTDFRNQKKRFGIKQADRTRHVYVIGKTGMGKSTMLQNMAVQDVQSDRGMAFLDPHGSLVEELLDHIPEHRIDDVLYFAPFDLNHPISFNVMEDVGHERRHLVANGLMSAFKKIWVDVWSARMEYILNNTLLALLEYPDSTLLGVNRMLSDKVYRKRVVANISDVAVRAFWEDEFASYSERYMQEAGSSIQNKIGQFISNPLIRNIVGQSRSSFDVRELMDRRKILLINLSKGKVGEDNANLLGSMLITKIYLAAMSRSDVSPYELKALPQFYFYVDEFQSFANESFADILSEARKYNLSLTIAHQYIEQMTDEVRAAVFGNVGTMMSFRVGATDAEVLEREYAPTFEAADIVNLGFAQIYLRLMIDGVGSKPFSATTLPPIPQPQQSFADQVIRRSRENYALKRSEVEEQLVSWHESHAGLIDDPQVKRRREKEIAGKEKHVSAYLESRESLDSDAEDGGGIQIPRPVKAGDNSNPLKAEAGSNSDMNQRLQKAIAKTQIYHEEAKKPDPVEKPKQANESFSDLRSTLADVLKDAGLKVPSNNKSNDNDQTKSESKKGDEKQEGDSKEQTKQESKKEQKENSDNGADSSNTSADNKTRNSRGKDNSKSSQIDDIASQPGGGGKSATKKKKRPKKAASKGGDTASSDNNKKNKSRDDRPSPDDVERKQSKNNNKNPGKTSQDQSEKNSDRKKSLESDPATNSNKNSHTSEKSDQIDVNQQTSVNGKEKQNISNTGAQFELPEDDLRKLLEV